MTAKVLKHQPSKLSEINILLQSVSSLIDKKVSMGPRYLAVSLDTPGMGVWGSRLWGQVVRSFPEAITSQNQKWGTLVDAEPGGNRVCDTPTLGCLLL